MTKKLTAKQRRELLGNYAISGHNAGLLCGPHHAKIASGECPVIYRDAVDAGIETEARKAYLTAYRKARARCDKSLGPGRAFSL